MERIERDTWELVKCILCGVGLGVLFIALLLITP